MNSLVDDSGNAQVWIGRSSLLWELDLSPLSGFPRTFWSFSLIFLSTPSYFDFFRKREASSNDELSYRRPRPAFPYTFLPCHIFSFSLFSLSISLLYLWLWSFVGAFVGARHRVMWKCYDRPTKVSSVFFSFHVYRFFFSMCPPSRLAKIPSTWQTCSNISWSTFDTVVCIFFS